MEEPPPTCLAAGRSSRSRRRHGGLGYRSPTGRPTSTSSARRTRDEALSHPLGSVQLETDPQAKPEILPDPQARGRTDRRRRRARQPQERPEDQRPLELRSQFGCRPAHVLELIARIDQAPDCRDPAVDVSEPDRPPGPCCNNPISQRVATCGHKRQPRPKAVQESGPK